MLCKRGLGPPEWFYVPADCRMPCRSRSIKPNLRLQAEREGFEPSRELAPPTRLAGECLQPLGHLSGRSGRL
jgi:hypothetical protein